MTVQCICYKFNYGFPNEPLLWIWSADMDSELQLMAASLDVDGTHVESLELEEDDGRVNYVGQPTQQQQNELVRLFVCVRFQLVLLREHVAFLPMLV